MDKLNELIQSRKFDTPDNILPCQDCNADCCGLIPMSKEFVSGMWSKYNLEPILGPIEELVYVKIETTYSDDEAPSGLYNGECKCVFSKNNNCLIYDDRPIVCSRYGMSELLPCPYANIEVPKTVAERDECFKHAKQQQLTIVRTELHLRDLHETLVDR